MNINIIARKNLGNAESLSFTYLYFCGRCYSSNFMIHINVWSAQDWTCSYWIFIKKNNTLKLRQLSLLKKSLSITKKVSCTIGGQHDEQQYQAGTFALGWHRGWEAIQGWAPSSSTWGEQLCHGGTLALLVRSNWHSQWTIAIMTSCKYLYPSKASICCVSIICKVEFCIGVILRKCI